MKRNKCPYKPPRPPRCLCRSFKHWLFGIVSPSLCMSVSNDKTRKYWDKLAEYESKVAAWYKTDENEVADDEE